MTEGAEGRRDEGAEGRRAVVQCLWRCVVLEMYCVNCPFGSLENRHISLAHLALAAPRPSPLVPVAIISPHPSPK
jgi:hypothetical protein